MSHHSSNGAVPNSDFNVSLECLPPPEYLANLEAGPLPDKVPLDNDVIVASSDALPQKAEFEDPWKSISGDLKEGNHTPWIELSLANKVLSICWVTIRISLVFCFLYLFICSLDLMQGAFQLIAGRTAGAAMSNSALINNPVCGLMIGVLVTVLLQSSSTSSSIVVSLVATNILTVQQAIPVIMGANIGTSVTNTIVALAQSTDRDTFRRAFAGATVHDMFNWLTVLILLPLEVATDYLYHLTSWMTHNMNPPQDAANPQFLKVITSPLTDLIIKIDKSVITAIAADTDRQKFPVAKFYCKEVDSAFTAIFPLGGLNQTFYDSISSMQFSFDLNTTDTHNSTVFTWKEVEDANSTLCTHLYTGCGTEYGKVSENAGGVILLTFSLFTMIACLLLMVKVLNSLMKGPMATVIQKSINADLPGRASFLTGYLAILVGAFFTVLVQSSSVFTSTLTPLVGMGVVQVERMYPLTLGSNIGTTITSLLAAFTADPSTIVNAIQISLCHLFFNITGILIFYPVPVMRRVPIRLAKKLGNTTAKYRWFAVAYLLLMFFVMPGVVFALSLLGWYVLAACMIPIVILVGFVITVNCMRDRCIQRLPAKLHDWDWLPKPCHSLKPYDNLLTSCCQNKCCQKCCKSCGDVITQAGVDDTILYIVPADMLDPKSSDGLPQDEVLEVLGLNNGTEVVLEKSQHGCDNPAFESELQTRL